MGETRGNTVLRPEVAVLMRPGTRIQFGVEPERSLILPLDESIAPGPVFSALMAAHRGTNITDALERAQQEAGLPERFVRALVQDLWQADLVQREPPDAIAAVPRQALGQLPKGTGSTVPKSAPHQCAAARHILYNHWYCGADAEIAPVSTPGYRCR